MHIKSFLLYRRDQLTHTFGVCGDTENKNLNANVSGINPVCWSQIIPAPES